MKRKTSPASGADVEQRIQDMLSKLRASNFRITPQRLAVLRALAASEEHPTVEGIFATVRSECPTTSIATVYKTVHLLKQVREVLELGFADSSNRYDGNRPFPHPHLICVRCRRIIDPDLDSLKELTAEVSAATGFDIQSHRLDFFGVCAGCQKQGPGKDDRQQSS